MKKIFFIVIMCTQLIHSFNESEEKYDLIVIGAGAAGLEAAATAASLYHKRVLIVEKNRFGGSYLWTGDIPSKTLVQTANHYHKIKKTFYSRLFEVNKESLNTEKLFPYISYVCENVYHTRPEKYYTDLGIEFIVGSASFLDNHTIQVGNDTITAGHFIVATGSSPNVPDILGIEDVQLLFSDNLFALKQLPESMIIIGGGPLGIEIGSALSKLGVRVTIVAKYGVILPTYDYEIVDTLMKRLEREGVLLECNMKTDSIQKAGSKVILNCTDIWNTAHQFEADSVFIAAGRHPNIDGLCLENAGVKYTDQGISVGPTLATSANNIYACGDVVGNINLLSRVAYYQAGMAVRNIFDNLAEKEIGRYTDVVKIIYTTSALTSIGLTEQDARKIYGDTLTIYRLGYDKMLIAHTDVETDGVAKFIFDSQGKLLGAHILGDHSEELISLLTLHKNLHDQLAHYSNARYIHPTHCDLLWYLLQIYSLDFPPSRNYIKDFLRYVLE